MPIRRELRKFYTGPAWQATRARIRERAGDRCERCGAPNGDHASRWSKRLDATKVITIQCGCAHIDHTDISRFYADDNLMWLCRGCHLRTDQPFHRDSRAARKDASRPLLQEASA